MCVPDVLVNFSLRVCGAGALWRLVLPSFLLLPLIDMLLPGSFSLCPFLDPLLPCLRSRFSPSVNYACGFDLDYFLILLPFRPI